MFYLLELALNNNYIYVGIIIILVVIITITILSIKKDRDEAIKARNKELQRPTEEVSRSKLELESVIDEMQKKLDMKENKITKYEEEQEENAIISYQELVKTMKKDSIPHNEVGMEVADSNVIDKIEEPLTYDIEEKVDYIYEEDIKEEPKIEEQKKEPKFKNSEFISPIYGTDKNLDIKKDVVTSNKAFVMDDIIDEDFDEEDEFLDSLKDFRKNL